jgi:membrane protease subunit HflC
MTQTKINIFIIIAIASVLLASGSIFIVTQTEQALILQFGNPIDVKQKPGLYFKKPFLLQDVMKFEKRVLDYNGEPKTIFDKDQKPVLIDAFAKYRINNALEFYKSVKNEQGINRILDSVVESRLRRILGSIPFSNLLSADRNKVMTELKTDVADQVRKFGIEVLDVRIMRADLPEKNANAVFERMIAEREKEAREYRAQGAEEAKRITSRADRERTILLAEAREKSEITRGQGDAEATKIFAQSFGKDADFFEFYRTMQAYKEALKKDDTSMVLSPNSKFLRYFDKAD